IWFLQGRTPDKFAAEPVPILPNNSAAPTGSSVWGKQKCELLRERVVGRQRYSRARFGNVVNSAKTEGCSLANVDPGGTTVVLALILAQFRFVSKRSDGDHPSHLLSNFTDDRRIPLIFCHSS